MPKTVGGMTTRRGDFRLTSYEWGVTYSAMLSAAQITGDSRYADYAMDRMSFLAEQAPRFIKMKEKGEKIDPLMEQVVSQLAHFRDVVRQLRQSG